MDRLNQILESKRGVSNVSGQWFSIQWTPDISTNEKLNIGVGLLENDGAISIQMLDYFERVTCLYSKEMIFQLELICEVSRELILKNGISKKEITPQVVCETRGFAQGKSVSEVLNQLYSTVVTLGKKVRKRVSTPFSSVSRDTAYNGLKERLKINLELDYSFHVPVDPYQEIVDGTFVSKLYLPFRKKSGNATLVSTAYSDKQRVKCNLYDGYRDLDIAAQKLKHPDNAIFLLLPGNGLKEDNQIAIENELDKFVWYMGKHGIHVGAHVSSEHLADEVSDWCLSAA